jgi:hypothetical protein
MPLCSLSRSHLDPDLGRASAAAGGEGWELPRSTTPRGHPLGAARQGALLCRGRRALLRRLGHALPRCCCQDAPPSRSCSGGGCAGSAPALHRRRSNCHPVLGDNPRLLPQLRHALHGRALEVTHSAVSPAVLSHVRKRRGWGQEGLEGGGAQEPSLTARNTNARPCSRPATTTCSDAAPRQRWRGCGRGDGLGTDEDADEARRESCRPASFLYVGPIV